jgi:hypothetical protein
MRGTVATREPDRNDHPETPVSDPTSHVGATLARAAWMAIILGLVIEILLLVLGGALGKTLGLGPIVADLVRNVSWSVFVCVGLAVGTAVVKARVPLMGLLGLLSAPLAFEVSRVMHKGTLEALAATGEVSSGQFSVFLVGLVKGLEYAVLGMAIGWVGKRPWGGAVAHAAVGLAIGLVFGGTLVGIAHASAPEPLSTADLVTRAVNEILFPVGCSLVLFAATSLGKKAAERDKPQG